jgi:phosphatidylinositol alpha-mannosyltransferase
MQGLDPMKIVEICPYDMLRPGGVQSHIRDLAHWLVAKGHEVRILAPPSPNGETSDIVQSVGKSRTISFHGTVTEICYASSSEIKHLASELTEWGADVLHLHTPWTPLLPWQVWHKTRLPAVATFHATLPERRGITLANRLLHRTAGYFMQRLEATIVPSISPLNQLRHISPTNTPIVLPPSIDLSPWVTSVQGIYKYCKLPVSIFFLGRMEERKGFDVMLKALQKISQRLPG